MITIKNLLSITLAGDIGEGWKVHNVTESTRSTDGVPVYVFDAYKIMKGGAIKRVIVSLERTQSKYDLGSEYYDIHNELTNGTLSMFRSTVEDYNQFVKRLVEVINYSK